MKFALRLCSFVTMTLPFVSFAQVSNPDVVLQLEDLAAPAAGATVFDPTFGVEVRRLTDLGEMGSAATADYPQLQAVNANETRIYLNTDDGRIVIDTSTWQVTHRSLPGTLYRWSPIDPDVFFHFNRRSGGPISLQTTTLMSDGTFVTEDRVDLSALGFETLDFGSWEDLSDDGRFVPLMGTTSGMGLVAAVLDLNSNTLSAVVPISNADWVGIAPSGRYFVVQFVACGDAADAGLAVFDVSGGAFLGHVSDHYAHGDLGTDADGNDVFVTMGDPTLCNEATPSYVVAPLPDAVERDAARTIYERGGQAIGIYTSCRSYDRAGLCLNSDEWSQVGSRPFARELWLTRMSDGAVLRIGHHRSRACSYGTQTRPTLSPTGRYVLWTSDWADPNCEERGDVYLIDTAPFLDTLVARPAPPDAGIAQDAALPPDDAAADSGAGADGAVSRPDAGPQVDAGHSTMPLDEGSCGCSSATRPSSAGRGLLLVIAGMFFRRRSSRSV